MSATSKRITRLRSRQVVSSVRTVPARKVQPKKVVNRNLKKVDVSTKDESLEAPKRSVSPPKISQASPIRLRPRRNRKNYCEDSKLLQQHISPKQRDSLVMVEKLDLKASRKVPVYKTMHVSEKSSEDDVYDYKFDINDEREKATKKKKNRGTGKVKKTTRKKVTKSKATGCETIKLPEPDASLSVKIVQNDPPLVTKENITKKIETLKADVQAQKKSANKDIGEEIEPPRIEIQTVEESAESIVEIVETSRADTTNVGAVEETTSGLSDRKLENVKKKDINKPKIVSIENANNIRVVASAPNTEPDSQPFRASNIFDNKTPLMECNSTLKGSLLTKTLSPILKMGSASTLGHASPWRPSTLMFSRTKHFIQSTPYKNCETHKENKEINKKSVETDKENMEMDKENMDTNKENKNGKDNERKKTGLRKKRVIQRKLPNSENQAPKKIRAAVASKSVAQPVPARVSLGEIKNLLQRLNVNGDKKHAADQTHTEIAELHVEETNKLAHSNTFSDTFDVLSETERLSNVGNDNPLFVDLEPTRFSEPPRYSYGRKRAVKFDLLEENSEEKEEDDVQPCTKKKKLTKSKKEQDKRINEWVKTINNTFQEIEEYDLIIE
ncbi:PREDICTED: uncharacterized protein LOC105562026 [Vollenhovia emeryi]|uniref:uncharacterized protein LOC105562026 n=1 Tax=Vollenhovia emeryi TaxID=411798 RepID=UPI0005F3E0C0|nr:PREDICTED: uncharacterized protein LOC105562026 [Vollenhovia emeryi]